MIGVGTKNGLPAASDIENDSGVAGAYISDALDTLNSAIVVPVNASDLTNDSTVTGVTVADALNTLLGGLTPDASDINNDSTVVGITVADALNTLASSGGGPVLTEVIEAAPTSGQVITVTHPAVPLTGTNSGKIMFSGLFTVPGTLHEETPATWTDENLNENGASWVRDTGTIKAVSCHTGVGYFTEGNYIYVGVDWASATKKGLIVLAQNPGANPNIHYVLTLGADFAPGDNIVEWDGAANDATATVGSAYDSDCAGHFDIDPGPKVGRYARVNLAGGGNPTLVWTIGTDLTANSSVILSAYYISQGITSIFAIYGQGDAIYSYGGDIPGGDVTYTISDVLITAADMTTLARIRLNAYGYAVANPADNTYRAAVSLDNGATWLAHDGSAWQTILLSDLLADGMHMNNGYDDDNSWLDISGTALTSGDWDDLYDLMVAEGVALNLRVALGYNPGTVYHNISLIRAHWYEASLIQPISVVNTFSSDSGFLSIARRSTTDTEFTVKLGYGYVPTDWHCQVRTGA
jgi:hypothetical protein